MFASRDSIRSASAVIDIAFTDRLGGVSLPPFDTLDLSRFRGDRGDELESNLALVADAFGVAGFAGMRQVHGADVRVVDSIGLATGSCDALVTAVADVALMVRVGDCAPVVFADVGTGVVAVAHVGRGGLAAGVVPATVATMRELGAASVEAWVGPHVCGGCYEVPAPMRDEVAAVVPTSYACTTWGSPSLDIGAGVRSQLERAGCAVRDHSRCTVESPDLYSHRRDGDRSGRFAGLVVRRPVTDE